MKGAVTGVFSVAPQPWISRSPRRLLALGPYAQREQGTVLSSRSASPFGWYATLGR
jgi:hypothetical protein